MFVMTGDAITLAPDTVQTDVAAFEQAVAERTPAALEQAVGLYRGDLLAGLSAAAPTFEDWLMSERERLRELALEALARLLAHQRAVGAIAPAVQSALRLLAIDPLQEAVHRTLMRLYVQLTRRDAALRQYQECVEVLRHELAVEPEAETKELYQEILRQRPVLAAPTPMVTGPSDAPLLGRDAEVASLHQALAEAWTGRERVIVVGGEAGIGKSRLLAELGAEAARRGGAILLGRSYESEQTLPFGPWVSALRDAGVVTDQQILGDLERAWRTELARLLPELGDTSRPVETSPPDQLRLFEALAQLLRCVALRQPLVVLLEDCHWADDMTLRLLAFCARRLHSAPILLVVSVRDEELLPNSTLYRTLEELATEDRLSRVTLSGLGRDATLTLVRLLARANAGAAALAQLGDQVWRASDGNPFIVLETMRAIGEGVAIASPGSLLLPARVRGMIARRLDRLSERARELVPVAAVIGREFEFPLLQRASGLDEQRAAEGLEELVRRRVLRAVGERFDLVHERIREVVYDQVSLPRRRLLHGRVAEALEALHAPQLEPHALALGTHYREAEVWAKAARFLRRAGMRALSRGAFREAAACLQQALETLEHLPESRDKVEQTIDLRLDLRNAMLPIVEPAAVLTSLREAEALARNLGDQRRLAVVLCHMADQFGNLGDYDRALEAGRRALATAEALEDFAVRINANVRLGRVHYARGDYELSVDVFTKNVELLTGEATAELFGLLQPPSIYSRTWLVGSLVELGRFAEARAAAESSLQIARSLDPWIANFSYVALGFIDLRTGELKSAIQRLAPALERIQTSGMAPWFPRLATVLGSAYALSGRAAEGLPLLEQVLQRALAARLHGARSQVVAHLGEAYLLAGRPHEASETVDLALELSRKHGERGDEAWSLRLTGEIAFQEGRAEGALNRFREAIELATKLGMQPLVAHCHLGLARVHRSTGHRAAAAEEQTIATAMFTTLGMRPWPFEQD